MDQDNVAMCASALAACFWVFLALLGLLGLFNDLLSIPGLLGMRITFDQPESHELCTRNNAFPLLQLPPELRNQTWSYLIPPSYRKDIRKPIPRSQRYLLEFTRLLVTKKERRCLSILAVNRQIYNEASTYLYPSIPFDLHLSAVNRTSYPELLPLFNPTLNCVTDVTFHIHLNGMELVRDERLGNIRDKVLRARTLLARMPNLRKLKIFMSARTQHFGMNSGRCAKCSYGKCDERLLEPLADLRGIKTVEIVWGTKRKGTPEYMQYLINQMTRPWSGEEPPNSRYHHRIHPCTVSTTSHLADHFANPYSRSSMHGL